MSDPVLVWLGFVKTTFDHTKLAFHLFHPQLQGVDVEVFDALDAHPELIAVEKLTYLDHGLTVKIIRKDLDI